MVEEQAGYGRLQFHGPRSGIAVKGSFGGLAAQSTLLSWTFTPSRYSAVSVVATGAVTVENDRIVGDPARMAIGLGYPVVLKGRRWWVENVDGDTIRFYRGPKV